MASLGQLLEGIEARVHGDPSIDIAEIVYDSRRVTPGALFVALRGTQTDGHRFIPQALEAGAAALVVEDAPGASSPTVPTAVVSDSRAAMAEMSARLLGNPAGSLTLVGVTGTNGKTSTVRMIESILNQAGRRAGSIGTISTRYPGGEEVSALTTPESADLQRTLARMRDAEVDSVAMEVSSHSLSMGRVRPLRFKVAVFTNLTQDHLDYHGDMERYAGAKSALFGADYLDGTAVLHQRDPVSAGFAEVAREAGNSVLTFARGADSGAELRTLREEVRLTDATLVVETPQGSGEVHLPLPGDFQIENALAAAGAALALGVPWEQIRQGLASCEPVPGRLEPVGTDGPFVFVDYAHTPDALDAVLSRIRGLVGERLICVFGCGGDRDRTKRAPMARAACLHSDYVIATSDNPRSEDPAAILADVSKGLSGQYQVVVERGEAVRLAIGLARPQDVVLIAGKGHEDYQIIGDRRLDFDDRVEARRALAARGART